MINTEIVNAKIRNWFLRKNEHNITEFVLEIEVPIGHCLMYVYPSDIDKVFNILEIKDIKEIKGAACIALIYDRSIKTIGNFLFKSASEYYTDINKIKEHDKNYWLDYDIFLNYNDKY